MRFNSYIILVTSVCIPLINCLDADAERLGKRKAESDFDIVKFFAKVDAFQAVRTAGPKSIYKLKDTEYYLILDEKRCLRVVKHIIHMGHNMTCASLRDLDIAGQINFTQQDSEKLFDLMVQRYEAQQPHKK